MVRAKRATFVLASWVLAGFVFSLPSTAQTARITGRWLGQDGHDYCGEITNAIKPNGMQDVHIALTGLPPRREIASVKVNGHGADEWRSDASNQFGARLVRKPNATTADLFFEAFHPETGRQFALMLSFTDGSSAEVYLKGGKADPNLRMAGSAFAAQWVGQQREDRAGLGPGVGPDGRIDARIVLSKLPARDPIKAVEVDDGKRAHWAFGINPQGRNNAELLVLPKEPTAGSLFFQPDVDLGGHRLSIRVRYESGKSDAATLEAGRTDPNLAPRRPVLPTIGALTLNAKWLGQGEDGDVRIALSGLSGTKSIAGAVLTDPVRGVWVYRAAGARVAFEIEPHALPLVVRRGADRTTAELVFPPVRDESKTPLSLRLIDATGNSSVATIEGGPCDVSRRAPRPSTTEVTANPGDDLNALVRQYGTVRLAKGDHRLPRPLDLPKPVNLVGEPGAALTFSQAENEPAWSTAIKIHSGGTTLRGFKVRFAGPIRWNPETSWSPAVIGTTDNFDRGPNPPKVHLVFEQLDLEGPPAVSGKPFVEAPKLMRLLNATSGRIVGNALRGGVIECFEGPWVFENNDYRGTFPGTTATAVFVVHDPHDVLARNNTIRPVGASGKTWRFLIFTGRGAYDRVENNTIEQVGPRDDDVVPFDNQPETILTESYHVRYEGKPSAISADGRLVRVGVLPGEPPRVGDVLSVVAGPAAGSWRRIIQRIEPDLYLLESPLPRGADVVEVTPALVFGTFSGNTISARGGGRALGFALTGNQFGTRVVNNRIIGSGLALQIYAYASESPGPFGWTHVPFLDGLIAGNTIEDSPGGGIIGVFHNEHSKFNQGRVYMTAAVKGNTIRWTRPVLASGAPPRMGLRLGVAGGGDPGECVLEESDTKLDAPAGTDPMSALYVESAVVNKKPMSKVGLPVSVSRGDLGKSQIHP